MLDELDNLAFGDASNLIQVQAPLALGLFGVHGGAYEGIGNHGDGSDCGATEGKREFPIGQKRIQRADSCGANGPAS
jgi:hypothetical protein